MLYLQGYRSKRKVVSGSRVTLPENFACKPGLSFNPLARVTLAVGLPYLLVNRALIDFLFPDSQISSLALKYSKENDREWVARRQFHAGINGFILFIFYNIGLS